MTRDIHINPICGAGAIVCATCQPDPNPLSVGDIVYVQGYEFEVVEVQESRVAPDGRTTHGFKGKATNTERNKTILGTGFALGNYSYRPTYLGSTSHHVKKGA